MLCQRRLPGREDEKIVDFGHLPGLDRIFRILGAHELDKKPFGGIYVMGLHKRRVQRVLDGIGHAVLAPTVTPEDIAAVYGREKVKEWKMAAMKQKYVVLKPSQFDDHETIMLLERVPAYNRDIRFNQQIEQLDSAEPEKPASKPDDTNGGTRVRRDHER